MKLSGEAREVCLASVARRLLEAGCRAAALGLTSKMSACPAAVEGWVPATGGCQEAAAEQ